MIYIDPGHGGTDPGAVGPAGTREAAINMMISRKLQAILTNRAISSRLTHSGEGAQPGSDPNSDLNARTAFIRNQRPEICISNHCNAAADRAARGIEIFYYPNHVYGRLLAERVYSELIQVSQAHGIPGRGIKTANFAMTREPARIGIPAILIEYAFISNPTEEKTLNNPIYQDQAAAAVAKGVMNYMGIESRTPSPWELKLKEAAEWVKIKGISDGSRPNDPITRGELFVILQALASRGAIKL